MRATPNGLPLALALTLLLGAQGRRFAVADELRDEARAHHDLGKVLFAQARYTEAEDQFRTAYRLAPIPDLLYNIGRCRELVGDRDGAVTLYRQYPAARPDAEEQVELKAHIAELQAQVATAPTGARLDSALPRTAPPAKPDPTLARATQPWSSNGAAGSVTPGVPSSLHR